MATKWHHSTFPGWVTVPEGADDGAQAYLALIRFVAVMHWMHAVQITKARPIPKRAFWRQVLDRLAGYRP